MRSLSVTESTTMLIVLWFATEYFVFLRQSNSKGRTCLCRIRNINIRKYTSFGIFCFSFGKKIDKAVSKIHFEQKAKIKKDKQEKNQIDINRKVMKTVWFYSSIITIIGYLHSFINLFKNSVSPHAKQ